MFSPRRIVLRPNYVAAYIEEVTTRTLVLVHEHFDAAHLAAVKAEMLTRGAPTLRAIRALDTCYLLEGCHRARAAAELGLTVEIDWVEYPEDDTISVGELLGDGQAECSVASLTDRPGPVLDVDWA